MRGPGGRGILAIQTVERARYETLVTELQPADLLYIRNDKGRIAHVILWLGVVGVSPNHVPLVLDATGGNHKDAERRAGFRSASTSGRSPRIAGTPATSRTPTGLSAEYRASVPAKLPEAEEGGAIDS